MIHSFSGPVDYAETVIAMGLSVSFSGLVFRRGEEASAEAVTLVPADRLLVETDSPFLTPPGGPRGRNEPSAVAITARWAAERRGVGRTTSVTGWWPPTTRPSIGTTPPPTP